MTEHWNVTYSGNYHRVWSHYDQVNYNVFAQKKLRDWLGTFVPFYIYAPCPLDLCHSIGLWPPFSAFRPSTRPVASISACGLNFRPAAPVFRQRVVAAATKERLPYVSNQQLTYWYSAHKPASQWENSFHPTIRPSLVSLAATTETLFLQKVQFSQTDDPSATFYLAHVPITYDTNLLAKFRGRMSCR